MKRTQRNKKVKRRHKARGAGLTLHEGAVHHEVKCPACANVSLPAPTPHVAFFPFLLSLNFIPHLNGIELQGVRPL